MTLSTLLPQALLLLLLLPCGTLASHSSSPTLLDHNTTLLEQHITTDQEHCQQLCKLNQTCNCYIFWKERFTCFLLKCFNVSDCPDVSVEELFPGEELDSGAHEDSGKILRASGPGSRTLPKLQPDSNSPGTPQDTDSAADSPSSGGRASPSPPPSSPVRGSSGGLSAGDALLLNSSTLSLLQKPPENPHQGGDVSDQGGDVKVPDQGGDVKVPDQGGDVKVPDQGGDVENPHQGGDVENPHQGGDVENPHQGGDVKVPDQGGDVKVPDQGGDVKVPDQGGDVKVPDQGGDVENPHQDDYISTQAPALHMSDEPTSWSPEEATSASRATTPMMTSGSTTTAALSATVPTTTTTTAIQQPTTATMPTSPITSSTSSTTSSSLTITSAASGPLETEHKPSTSDPPGPGATANLPSSSSSAAGSKIADMEGNRGGIMDVAGSLLTKQLVDTSSLLAVLLFGLLFFLVTVVMFVTQAYESYRRKDYTQVDYLINGMYSDSGV
ncbi:uncharacterized protein wu:fa25f02 [Hypomesus transpacificus]|uniref:uncharacterized protein wu:fa25f02 n=1 Tax=Hypomesus transpacificus TaxID=137520 RepID=UPI001F074090|nr:uncharacterized protein wu:fa25f02 [Hypomesus transpacificus]XP_046889679.1 uncharacterized protein wu:fa25f02 [Hypomesus transpacificus]XP_046889680.1 uncharacterized protein wu:fa25f02 [Hypomesus transpacificus]